MHARAKAFDNPDGHTPLGGLSFQKVLANAMNKPTTQQLNALREFAQRHGRTWKAKLKSAWASGKDEQLPNAAFLRQIRNDFGPLWLTRFNLGDASTQKKVARG